MKRTIFQYVSIILAVTMVYLPIWSYRAMADDTCVFMLDEDELIPNIVFLLDNGAEMQHVTWLSGYDDDTDYSPVTDEASQVDLADDDKKGNGFYNENGYIIETTKYCLEAVGNDLLGDSKRSICPADSKKDVDAKKRTVTYTFNGKTITLPAEPNNKGVSVGDLSIIDKAENYRYSANYLNWLFFSGEYTGDGSDLPDYSRLFWAKYALLMVGKVTANQAQFAIFNFTSKNKGASSVQPLGLVVDKTYADPFQNELDSNYVNNINNMGATTYSPLSEGLASIGGFYGGSNSGLDEDLYCVKNYIIVVTPGLSSEDLDDPNDYFQNNTTAVSKWTGLGTNDIDGDDSSIGEGDIKWTTTTDSFVSENEETIPLRVNGSTYMDDVAWFMNQHDMVDYVTGSQKLVTYTIGFMSNEVTDHYLINTSNNGNGNKNLYETTHPDYGDYHFRAEKPAQLFQAMLEAISNIISRKNSFTAPVVPVTRTTSGDRIYMAFFTPKEGAWWEGNVVKFGLTEEGQIIDKNGNAATYSNGAMVEGAEPYWQTKDWALSGEDNYMHNSTRNIYTYLGVSKDLTSSGNVFNSSNITKEMLANPTTDWDKVVAYIRGADIFDENNDGDTTDNREIITGDVLHSEPAVLRYDGGGGLIFFGANDGLFHAVDDNTGEEAWAYAPPEILHKLKEYVEGESHAYTVDGTPKVWIDDKDGDGYVDSGEKAIVVFGLRKGGRSYTAIDVSDPDKPVYLWRISGENEKSAGYSPTAPDWVESTLGETWSDPAFSKVMDGTAEKDAVFVGGGYKEDNSLGNTLLALNVKTGSLLEKWTLGTTSVAAEPYPVDITGDYIADKLYIGDAGGDMWRLGYFPDEFPAADHNIQNWKTHKLFDSEGGNTGFFYAPAVTLQQDYDIVFIGSGDRDDPCNESTQDYLYAIKDDHGTDTRKLADLENTTTTPLNEGDMDLPEVNGWYYKLALGEKALAKGTIFYKVFYITTFVPGTGDPCVPGGTARLYALGYLTAGAKVDFDDDGANDRSLDIGGGIPSKPVIVVTDEHSKLLISTGTTAADENSPDTSAGIVAVDPVAPKRNFFSLWWREF